MTDRIHIASGVVVNPGDRLVIGLQNAHISRDDLVQLRNDLEQQLPDVRFTIVTGVGEMAVLPALVPPSARRIEDHPSGGGLKGLLRKVGVVEPGRDVFVVDDGPPDDRDTRERRKDADELRRELTLARLQRDRLIHAVRDHLDGKCGRTTRLLTDTVDLVEHEIGATE